nr:RNA-directed DNA polymerase, eukaryota [Tanacetum cinerariifolium]
TKTDTKVSLMNHTGVKSWFHVIQEACNDFVSDERIVWVDIEGVPMNAWTRETFSRIGNKWGVTLDLEENADNSFGLTLMEFLKPNLVLEHLRCLVILVEPNPSLSHPPGFTPENLENRVEHGTDFGATSGLNAQAYLKRVIWEYISVLIGRWNGEVIIMGDFNEVRSTDERRGSMFYPLMARCFNNFISSSGLVDIKLEGFSFTWSHPSASKLSINLAKNHSLPYLVLFPSISALCLDRHLSNHRPILLHEVHTDFGPIPFGFYHSWFSFEGFDDMVEHTWNSFSLTDYNDYRPISLIGCIYKVVTKVLSNRLAPIISDLVSDTQSAFVANRRILDGPFIISKVISWCKRKKKQAMFFKVDFTKAYDSVRWDFLLDVLQAFGFGPNWCKWIRGTFSNAMASILVNGSPSSEFQFYSGLKQGDPLSPYLFILIMESLHFSFSRVVNEGICKGISLNGKSSISHLFYADDAMFVREWSEDNLKSIVSILKCFFFASGLKINFP